MLQTCGNYNCSRGCFFIHFSCTLCANPNYFKTLLNIFPFSHFWTTIHSNSIIDKLDVLDMFNIFVEAANPLDILGDRHTNPTPKVTIDIKSKIFINNSLLILDFIPRLIHQESTRQVIQTLVDQPSHDNVVVCCSIDIINDYNCDIWKHQFPEIFPYGCGSSDEQRLTKLELEAYMANVL